MKDSIPVVDFKNISLGYKYLFIDFSNKIWKQTKDPKYLFRKPAQEQMNVLILYAMSLKQTRITCVLLFFQHMWEWKQFSKKKNFNIAVSCKRNPHTTPSNDLVANTYMHVFKLYTESMQQWVDILDLQVQSCCMQTVGSYLPLDPSGWFRAAAECLG